MREDLLARRSVAALIDLVVCILLFWLLFRLFGREVYRGQFTFRVVSGWPMLSFPAVWLFYYPFTESCLQGTLGKLICGLRVVFDNGKNLTFGGMFLRRLLDPLEVWFAFGMVGWIIVAASSDGRRLGDKLAGTQVVRRKAVQLGASAGSGPAEPLGNSGIGGRPPSVS